REAKNGKTTVLCIGESPFQALGLKMNFYRHPNLTVLNSEKIDTLSQLHPGMHQGELFVFTWRKPDEQTIARHNLEQVYSAMPEWVKKFNFNNWADRTKIGMYYRVRK